jgi:hypothetical protein
MADWRSFKPHWWYPLIAANRSRCRHYDGNVNYFFDKSAQANDIPCRCV